MEVNQFSDSRKFQKIKLRIKAISNIQGKLIHLISIGAYFGIIFKSFILHTFIYLYIYL